MALFPSPAIPRIATMRVRSSLARISLSSRSRPTKRPGRGTGSSSGWTCAAPGPTSVRSASDSVAVPPRVAAAPAPPAVGIGPPVSPASGGAISATTPASPAARSSASANACTEAYRASTSLAMARSSTDWKAAGTPGAETSRASGSSVITRRIVVAMPPSERKGEDPVRASYSTTPRAHTSARGSAGCPRICSGAMYSGVPTIVPGTVSPWLSSSLTSPKSRILTSPSRVRNRFAGLMSRWTRPAPWAAASPRAAWRHQSAASRGSARPSASRACSVWPSYRAMTMKRRPSASSMPWMTPTLGWSRLAAALASSSSLRFASGCTESASGRNFRATGRSSRVSIAR